MNQLGFNEEFQGDFFNTEPLEKRFPNYDFQGAYAAGLSPQEVEIYLTGLEPDIESYKRKYPSYDFDAALDSGLELGEILEFLSQQEPDEKIPIEEEPMGDFEGLARIPLQYGVGLAQLEAMPYDIAVSPLASEDAQLQAYRETLSDDLEMLMDKKAFGDWDEQDQQRYDSIVDQLQNPEKSRKYIQTIDLSTEHLIEKATGIDLKPKNLAEQAARFTAFGRQSLPNTPGGATAKEVLKSFTPGLSQTAGGIGMALGHEIAEDGGFGPMGTIASSIVGDVAGRGLVGLGKKGVKLTKRLFGNTTENKKELAETVAKVFGPTQQKELQAEIVKSIKDAGITADPGTLLGSDLFRMMSTKVAQSAFGGKNVKKFYEELSDQVVNQYKKLANTLGEVKFSNKFEAGELLKNTAKNIYDKEKEKIFKLYDPLRKEAQNIKVNTQPLFNKIDKTIQTLEKGSIKAQETKSTLDYLKKLREEIRPPSRKKPLEVSVKDENARKFIESKFGGSQADYESMLNNKINLGQIINFESQGGTKQLLKSIQKDLDTVLRQSGNRKLNSLYDIANSQAEKSYKTYRTPQFRSVLRSSPENTLRQMDSVSGIRNIKQALGNSKEGKKLFEDLKRYKLEELVGNNFDRNVLSQAKSNVFSKIFDNPKKREILKEILPKESYDRLRNLSKATGEISKSLVKFANSSQTAVSSFDTALMLKGITDFTHLLTGNPWPLMKDAATVSITKKLSDKFFDPEFLKYLEDAVIKNANNPTKQSTSFKKLIPKFKEIYKDSDIEKYLLASREINQESR